MGVNNNSDILSVDVAAYNIGQVIDTEDESGSNNIFRELQSIDTDDTKGQISEDEMNSFKKTWSELEEEKQKQDENYEAKKALYDFQLACENDDAYGAQGGLDSINDIYNDLSITAGLDENDDSNTISKNEWQAYQKAIDEEEQKTDDAKKEDDTTSSSDNSSSKADNNQNDKDAAQNASNNAQTAGSSDNQTNPETKKEGTKYEAKKPTKEEGYNRADSDRTAIVNHENLDNSNVKDGIKDEGTYKDKGNVLDIDKYYDLFHENSTALKVEDSENKDGYIRNTSNAIEGDIASHIQIENYDRANSEHQNQMVNAYKIMVESNEGLKNRLNSAYGDMSNLSNEEYINNVNATLAKLSWDGSLEDDYIVLDSLTKEEVQKKIEAQQEQEAQAQAQQEAQAAQQQQQQQAQAQQVQQEQQQAAQQAQEQTDAGKTDTTQGSTLSLKDAKTVWEDALKNGTPEYQDAAKKAYLNAINEDIQSKGTPVNEKNIDHDRTKVYTYMDGTKAYTKKDENGNWVPTAEYYPSEKTSGDYEVSYTDGNKTQIRTYEDGTKAYFQKNDNGIWVMREYHELEQDNSSEPVSDGTYQASDGTSTSSDGTSQGTSNDESTATTTSQKKVKSTKQTKEGNTVITYEDGSTYTIYNH